MKKQIEILLISTDEYTVNKLHKIFNEYNCNVSFLEKINLISKSLLIKDFDFYFIDTLSNINDILFLIDTIKDLKFKYNIIIISNCLPLEIENKIRSSGITYLLKKPIQLQEVQELLEYHKNSLYT